MKVIILLFVVVSLGLALGGKQRAKRAIRFMSVGAAVGFIAGFAYFWLHPLVALQHPATLAELSCAYHTLDWLAVSFVAGFFALAAGAIGFFLQGQPSSGVDAFDALSAGWDLLAFWRH